jgi:hypothetical protein
LPTAHPQAVEANNILAIEKSNTNFEPRRGWAGQNLTHDRATEQASVLAAMMIVERYL